ncbi:MAG: MFS transporter [Limisphaerales bacterium]
MAWPRALVALNSRNYRLFFAGQIVSLIGTWMTSTASLWLIYHLSSSAFLLGVIGFASQAPIAFLSPLGGVLADRFDRLTLLKITQILSALQSFAMAALAYWGLMNESWLIGLSLVQGIVNGIDMPVRQSLVVSFVEKREHVGNSIALNSAVFNLARLIGPALAGFIIVYVGAAGCYFVDGISYFAVIVSLIFIRVDALPERERRHPITEIREGFGYAWGFRPIRAILITSGLISFVGFSYSILMPLFAKDVFGGDARTLGYLMAATGVGAVIAGGYLSMRTTIKGLGNVIAAGGMIMGIGLMSFAFSRSLALSLLFLMIAGFGAVLMMAGSNTVLQAIVEEDKRGRVMALFTMAVMGSMPFGNLLIGWIARVLNAQIALCISGTVVFVVAVAFFRQLPKIREAAAPIMNKLGRLEIHS